MEKLRFTFTVLGGSDGKTNIICITSIETPDGRLFDIPEDLKPVSKNIAIAATDYFTKIKNSLKKRHQARKIWIPLTENLKKCYLDEGENIQFDNQYLDEITPETEHPGNNVSVSGENKKIGKIAERFLIEKFSGKTSSVNQWMDE